MSPVGFNPQYKPPKQYIGKGATIMETNAVSGLLTTVQTDVLSNVTSALPAAGAVFAAVAGIMIGIKLFKKITGVRGA